MTETFIDIFQALRKVMSSQASKLSVKTDTPTEYSLETKYPSPYKQHKGKPLWIGMVKVGKAYVSYHLMPIYMNPTLQQQVSPALKKRMQGKACFNFTAVPDKELTADLSRLTKAAVSAWAKPPVKP